MIIENSKLTSSTKFILENMHNTSNHFTDVTCAGKIRNRHMSDANLEFYSDGYGEFYLFGGHLMAFALIQADSFCSAYDIYLTEYVPCDELELDDDVGYGTFNSCGGFYSEATISYILELNPEDYKFDFEIRGN